MVSNKKENGTMTQYINKAALSEYLNQLYEKHSTPNSVDEGGVVITDIEFFLDTLEVKEVKEPTAYDRGIAEEIITNLKRVEQDYHIDLTREVEWIRNKAKEKQKLIDEACKWLFKNDSYATPTNVQVDRLREHLNKMKGE